MPGRRGGHPMKHGHPNPRLPGAAPRLGPVAVRVHARTQIRVARAATVGFESLEGHMENTVSITFTSEEVLVLATALRSHRSNTIAISVKEPPQTQMLRERLVREVEVVDHILGVLRPLRVDL